MTPLNSFFEGRIDDVRIYDWALDATQVGDLYGGSAPGPSTLPTVADTSGFSTPLDLSIQDIGNIAWIAGGGIEVTADTKFASAAAATKLYDALTATNELALEVIFTPANVTQDGPANIVSYSADTTSRNFTFGQDDEKYIQRLRTSDVGSNGTPDINSPDVLQADQQEHVVVSYQNGEVRLYRNGSLEHTEARTGDFSTWDSNMSLLMVNEATDDRPWLGKLHRVAIYDRSFNSVQATNVFNGQPPGDGSAAGFKIVWDENP